MKKKMIKNERQQTAMTREGTMARQRYKSDDDSSFKWTEGPFSESLSVSLGGRCRICGLLVGLGDNSGECCKWQKALVVQYALLGSYLLDAYG
jgi:hypothetical protein